MKKSKIIIPALGMLVLSTAATVSGTVAWFTMNKTAKAEGMAISAKTSGSLIVKEAAASSPQLPTASDRGTKVNFNELISEPHAFYPSTHADFPTAATSGLSADNVTGLQYVSNGYAVNFETGTRMNEDTDFEMANVTDGDSAYYFDYGLFLAGDGIAMPNQTLTITIDGNAVQNLNGALSIDFYGQLVQSAARAQASHDNFIGTLNLAKVYNATSTTTDARASISKTGVNIPVSGATTGDKAYAILMRVYFDGALIETAAATANDYAIYTGCGASETAVANKLYYTDNVGTAIVNTEEGVDVSSYYKVDMTNSTLCYARSINVAQIASQLVGVTFTAS